MTDRELLEAAAKAAIYLIHAERQSERDAVGYGHVGLWLANGHTGWNPLTQDGDALRLAVALRIDVAHFTAGVRADVTGYDDCYQANDADPYAATRRAIVRAAAALGGAL